MTDFAWLIEAPGPYYLEARELGHMYDFHWTRDPNRALRFHSEKQADATMMALRTTQPALFGFAKNLTDPRAIEHGWLDPAGAAATA